MPVGISAPSGQKWDHVQLAILMAGGIVVGIDPADTGERTNHMVRNSKIQAIVIDNDRDLSKFPDETCRSFKFIFCLESAPTTSNELNIIALPTLIQRRKRDNHQYMPKMPAPEDPATIIFTSGTTGEPKAILYTHRQLCIAIEVLLDSFVDFRESARLISWLPLSNLFQRIMNFCAISSGATTYYVEDPKLIGKFLPLVQPHIFIGVPRFYEKLYDAIVVGIRSKPFWIKRLIENSIDQNKRKCGSPAMEFCSRVVTTFLRKQMVGKNLKFMVSGSAPMPKWLLEEYNAIGILILEAYGISENALPISANTPTAYKFGTVGQPLSGNTIRFSHSGELLVKGPCVFKGYYGKRADNLTRDGYLKTGDYAHRDEHANIIITGRKSEIIKTSSGKRIAPAPIENRIRQLQEVEYAVICGHGKKYIIAVLALSEYFFRTCKSQSITDTPDSVPFLSDEVAKGICLEATKTVKNLPRYQQPAGYLLVARPFTVNGGELTSNLKLRRKQIEENYRKGIEQLYAKLQDTFELKENFVIY